MTETASIEEIKSNLSKLFEDQLINFLVKNSNLTKIQLETLIIELISENNSIEKVNYDLKGLLRLKKVTRGSFHRTLTQAKKNIISALFTVLLLMYIGAFNEMTLNEFKLLTDRLKEYLTLSKTFNSSQSSNKLRIIEKELLSALESLVEPKK